MQYCSSGSGNLVWQGDGSKARLTAVAGTPKSPRLLTLSSHRLEVHRCPSPSRRRRFLGAAGAVAAAAAIPDAAIAAPALVVRRAGRAAAVSSGNGVRAVQRAIELMAQGTDTLDAAVEGVKIQELDPADDSVGLADCPTKKASCSSTPPACMGPPSGPAPWPPSRASRRLARSRGWCSSTPTTSCWLAKEPSASRSRTASRKRIC